MPASNQQFDDAIGGTLQFCDSGQRMQARMQARLKSACHMLVVRTSHAGRRTFSTRGLPMPAHSGEINDEIARRLRETRCAQFFGIDFVIGMPASTAEGILRDERTRRVHGAHGKATHTDPQLLFWTAS